MEENHWVEGNITCLSAPQLYIQECKSHTYQAPCILSPYLVERGLRLRTGQHVCWGHVSLSTGGTDCTAEQVVGDLPPPLALPLYSGWSGVRLAWELPLSDSILRPGGGWPEGRPRLPAPLWPQLSRVNSQPRLQPRTPNTALIPLPIPWVTATEEHKSRDPWIPEQCG